LAYLVSYQHHLSRRILSQLPTSTAVKSLDMKHTQQHFRNKHIYKASYQAKPNIKNKKKGGLIQKSDKEK
jgi:hypothetical protein